MYAGMVVLGGGRVDTIESSLATWRAGGFAWDGGPQLSLGLSCCRRLAKDFERTLESAIAWMLVAHIRRLTRRLARA
jgi:hypothetical protein